MSSEVGYSTKRIYSLDEIRGLASNFKTVAQSSTDWGLVFLYRLKETNEFWIGGPLQGPGSNFFMYLGERESKSRVLDFLREQLKWYFEGRGTHDYDYYPGDGYLDDWMAFDFLSWDFD